MTAAMPTSTRHGGLAVFSMRAPRALDGMTAAMSVAIVAFMAAMLGVAGLASL
jgi:hypothetical protein